MVHASVNNSAATPEPLAPSTARAWLGAMRPRTLTASLGAVLVGAALAAADGRFRWDATIAAAVVAAGLQIGANLYNDYGDFIRGADGERIGPARAAAAGWLAPAKLRIAALVAIAFAALAGLVLVRLIGWPALAIGAVAMVSAVAYTAGPAPLAYVGLGDAFVLIFFGGVAVTGTYLAETGAISLRAAAASLAVGAMATAILVVNNLRDRDGDRRAGKRTLVVRFGERFGRAEYAALITLAYLVPLALAWIERRPALLLPFASAPLAALQLARLRTKDGAALNLELARTAQLGLAFDVLFALGVMS